jgi:hypothetical protein
VNIENVAIYVGNKFYIMVFQYNLFIRSKKGFLSGKTSQKRVFLGPKIFLVNGKNKLKIGYRTGK